MRSKNLKTILISVIIFLFACSSALYFPNETTVPKTANIENLKLGRQLYISNCASCHTLYLPEKYSNEEWVNWVDKMESKTKITPSEKKLILNYLTKGIK